MLALRNKLLLLFIIGTLVALTGVFVVSPSLTYAQDTSCQGIDACTGATGPIGANSCNGYQACYMASAAISDNSCNHDFACIHAQGQIGASSCNGLSSCNLFKGPLVNNNSCNGIDACFNVSLIVGEHSCTGQAACESNSNFVTVTNIGNGTCNGDHACSNPKGPLGNNSCNGEYACEAIFTFLTTYFHGPVGDNSCNAGYACDGSSQVGSRSCNMYSACAHSRFPIGEYSCNGEYACYTAAVRIGDNICNADNALANGCVDTTPPTANPTLSPVPNEAGWNHEAVTVYWNWTDASGIDDAHCTTHSTSTGEGNFIWLSAYCKDSIGNSGFASYTVKVDLGAPEINPTVSPNPVLLNQTATVDAGGWDWLSGVASQSCNAIDTSTAGVKSVTCTAMDYAGNSASATVSYSVIYNFAGFSQPVDNLPTLNTVKAGQAIPVKFSLGGNQGMFIFAVGYPASQQVTCNTGAPVDEIEQTVMVGGSNLSYDPATNQYNYVWKTNNAWAGTCRQLLLRLNDGSLHTANFKFK